MVAPWGGQIITCQVRCRACNTYFEAIRDEFDGSADELDGAADVTGSWTTNSADGR
jgi:hypothetical protein